MTNVQSEVAELGFEPEAPRLNEDRDMTWLYWRMRYRRSYDRIANRWDARHHDALYHGSQDPVELVKHAVLRMARDVGADVSGCG